MARINWEVCVILKEDRPVRGNVELIPCKDRRTALQTANRIKDRKWDFNYDYESIFVQANNGAEMLDDREIRIV